MHTKKEMDLLLHKLWTKAVGTEDYNKQEWLLLERMIWEDLPNKPVEIDRAMHGCDQPIVITLGG